MTEPSFADILQDRTHKYRRTLIAVCLIAMALYWLPIRFDELQLFGIRPEQGYPHTRVVILVVLWFVLLYHVGLFLYYVQRDWKDWRSELRRGDVAGPSRQAFPELGMYFPNWKWWWGRPSDALSKKTIGHWGEGQVTWRNNKDAAGEVWIATHSQEGVEPKRLRVPGDSARSVRSRVRWFVLVDCGFPLVLSLVALFALYALTADAVATGTVPISSFAS